MTHVETQCARLNLSRIPDCLTGLAEGAAAQSWSSLAFLEQVLATEIAARTERDIAMTTKLAHFPVHKRLEQFDFAFQPSSNERQVRELATHRFIADGVNLLLLGPPGTGKTHVAIAVGLLAISQSLSVSFITVPDLLEQLERDAKEDRLAQRLRVLRRPKLLILDEMGYFPLDRLAAQFLFQLVSRRYQKTSVIITSNKSSGEWGEIFADPVLASAILDRLLRLSVVECPYYASGHQHFIRYHDSHPPRHHLGRILGDPARARRGRGIPLRERGAG